MTRMVITVQRCIEVDVLGNSLQISAWLVPSISARNAAGTLNRAYHGRLPDGATP